MRQWIREHPWRLEVVPSVIFFLDTLIPLLYLRNNGTQKAFWEHYAVFALALLSVWVTTAVDNHRWVHNEVTKRFNQGTSFGIFILLCFGFGLLRRHSSIPVLVGWCIFGVICIAVQDLIEHKRPFIPYGHLANAKLILGAIDILPGEAFYYREDVKDPWKWVKRVVAFVFILCLVVLISRPDSTTWFLVCMNLPLIYIMLTSRNVFIIANEHVLVQIGSSKAAIRMSEIEECEVIDYEPAGWVRRFVPDDKPRRYLWLKTRKMPFYVLGMESPETACKLIRTALAARGGEGV